MPDLETRYGLLQVPDDKEDIIGCFLARYGEWAWLEVCFIADTLSDNARVLDAGAFIGTFGMGLALRRRLEKICLVECNPAIFGYLSTNVVRNLGCAFEVVEGMVAARGAELRSGHADMGNLGSVSYAGGHAGQAEVPAAQRVLALADLRQLHGPFDLIKLDIEGMEIEVLQGDAAYLSRGETSLWVECNEDRRSLDIADILLSWGMHLYYFAFPSFNLDNFKGDPVPLFPMAYEAGLLAAPRYAPTMSEELQEKGCILKTIRSRDDLKDALWRTPRWGRPEWEQTKSRPELAAVVCRSLRDEDFASFLEPIAEPDAPAPATLWQKLAAAEKGLDEARSLLESERRAAEAVTRGLENATELALSRLAEIEAERERREAAEVFLRDLQAQAENASLADPARIEALRAKAIAEDRAEAAELECAAASARGLAHLAKLGELRDQQAALAEEYEDTLAQMRDQQAALAEEYEAGLAQMREQQAAISAEFEIRLEHMRSQQDALSAAYEARLAELRDTQEVLREADAARMRDVQDERDAALEKAARLELCVAEEQARAQQAERHAERLAEQLADVIRDSGERAAMLELRLAEAQEHARRTERRLDDIRYSTVWRLSTPLRTVVEKIPVLHVSAKRCRALARVIIHGR